MGQAKADLSPWHRPCRPTSNTCAACRVVVRLPLVVVTVVACVHTRRIRQRRLRADARRRGKKVPQSGRTSRQMATHATAPGAGLHSRTHAVRDAVPESTTSQVLKEIDTICWWPMAAGPMRAPPRARAPWSLEIQ